MTALIHGPCNVLPDCHVWIGTGNVGPASSLSRPDVEWSPHLLLNPEDYQRWLKYRCSKKQDQFLQSRRVVRAVLEQELGQDIHRFVFGTDPSGRPFLRTAAGSEERWISISHSDSLTAVACSWGSSPVGIDIETIRPLRTQSLKNVFVTEMEQTWLREKGWLDNEEAIRVLWTIKESVWKSTAGTDSITLPDISVLLQNTKLITKLTHPNRVRESFRTRLIGSAFTLDWPDALVIKLPPTETSAFQGCLALWDAHTLPVTAQSNGL